MLHWYDAKSTSIILAQRVAVYIGMPFAVVIGTLGYFAEQRWGPKQKSLPYLDKSVEEARMDRQLQIETSEEFIQPKTLKDERKILVPKTSLDKNPAGKKFFEWFIDDFLESI